MSTSRITRRDVLRGITAASLLPRPAYAGRRQVREFHLTAKPAKVALVGAQHLDTAVWAYNGTIPGPEIRIRQGDRLRITVENGLAVDTTVHCHGIRLPNAMDGVPHLTQEPDHARRDVCLRIRRSGCRHVLVPPTPSKRRAGRPRALRCTHR
jgi:FtsP/CotA-like multicopper oxidase with cupredoxin domain